MSESAGFRRRALLVTRNLPPLVGGMERVNQRLLAELSQAWRVSLCGPQGCAALVPDGGTVVETRIKPLASFLIGTAWRAWRLARRERPEVVLAGSGLSAPMAWLAARASGAKLVVYLHGLDIIAPSHIYQSVWLPFIRACDLVLVNSGNTARLARERGIAGERISILHPGTEIPGLDPSNAAQFRATYELGQRPVMLSVGRLTRRKGLAEFVTRSLPSVVARRPESILAVIGEEAGDALHGAVGGERERVLVAARAAGVEANIRFLGRCDEGTLRAAYQSADCHVFPVLDLPGDVEGFGMVALESAANGLATVAFDVGGVADAVSEGVSGHLVPAGDYDQLASSILSLLDRPADMKQHALQPSREFARQFEWQRFGERLREVVAGATGTRGATHDG